MLTALLAAFIGGVILNLMPCVFPIVSLKALGLLRHTDNAAEARREGIAFLLGVTVTMMALASVLLALRAGGAAVGWGFQLQSPLVIALLSLVILVAALNLLGVFEVGLAAQRIGSLQAGRGAFVRSALTGALAIVVATPCAAPFMAGAIGFALVQPPAVALLVFFALALGFAAPFTVISLFPALATFLPRPGAWMDILKRGLAFPMFGACAWLVWVFTQQADSRSLAALFTALVMISFAAWLYGIAQRRRFQGKPHRILFVLTIVLAVIVIAPLPEMIGAESGQAFVRNETPSPTAKETWTPKKVAAERGHGRPIFVDFTASWCITCQVNEKTSLSTQAVKDAVAKTGTLYLVADSTKFNPDVDDALNEFGQGGLPMYVVYPADGGAPQVLPQVLTPGIVVEALVKAAGRKT